MKKYIFKYFIVYDLLHIKYLIVNIFILLKKKKKKKKKKKHL